jgi:hypothetical protein
VTENGPLKKIKIDGIILAADLVTKRRYKEAKGVLGKILKVIVALFFPRKGLKPQMPEIYQHGRNR